MPDSIATRNDAKTIKNARIRLCMTNAALFSFLGLTLLGLVGFISAAFLHSMEMFLILIAGTMLMAILATLAVTFKESVQSRLDKTLSEQGQRLNRNAHRALNH